MNWRLLLITILLAIIVWSAAGSLITGDWIISAFCRTMGLPDSMIIDHAIICYDNDLDAGFRACLSSAICMDFGIRQ